MVLTMTAEAWRHNYFSPYLCNVAGVISGSIKGSPEVNLHGNHLSSKSGSIQLLNPAVTSSPAMSFLEKLHAMFASVQNCLALKLTLAEVLHCRSAMLLRVMSVSWFLISPADTPTGSFGTVAKTALACLAAHNEVSGFF